MAPQRPTQPKSNSIVQSLARLGVRITRGQIIGAISGAIAGFIFARILPTIFTNTWGYLQNFLFGPDPSSFRDSLNTFIFTLFTFSCSFLIALLISLALSLWAKSRK